jgi:Zn-dependent protease with chaperone function
MATDFFQQQSKARRSTGLLVFYFVLAVVALIVLVYLLAAFLFLSTGEEPADARALWDPTLLGAVALFVGLTVGLGSLFKTAQLAAGGRVVAETLGGRLVPSDSRDPTERRLLNVVEEMAIASGVPVPPVYILSDEKGINAFAAGHSPGDAVVAVSDGCLTYLTRDELQGVVAHEFSHILNGDMRLNIRLLGLIFGILALSIIGRVVVQFAGRARSSSQRDDRSRQGALLFGIGLWLLGLVGAFFGRLIEAAVSRQREFLADASAVQFTRNPEGIGGALKKIGGLAAGSLVKSPHAAEAGHMFFADGLRKGFSGLFATHPPLAERIRRIDPQFDGVFPQVGPLVAPPEAPRPPQPRRVPTTLPGIKGLPFPVLGLGGEQAAAHVAHVTPEEISCGEGLRGGIPDSLRGAARDPFGARAAVYCLLLDSRPEVRQAQLAHLERSIDPRDFALTRRLADAAVALPEESRLPLLELTLPALRQMSPRQHAEFRSQVEALIAADRRVSVFEYALRCVLARHLDDGFSPQNPRLWPASAGQVADAATVVLSKLARVGNADEAAARGAFDAGVRAGGIRARGLLPPDQCDLPDFDAALRFLGHAPPEVKRRLVCACAATILADERVTVREGELLRAVCAVLRCPMPPLLAEPEGQKASS